MSSDRFSLTVDYAFKKFFVDHPDLLVDFLNAVFMEYDHLTIASLEILNPQLPGESVEDKGAILDILAEDDRGNRINIEMQAGSDGKFASRTAFYAFRLYVQGLDKGDPHSRIPPVYSVNLLDFNMFPNLDYHSCYRLLNMKDCTIDMGAEVEFHFIELKKLQKAIDEMVDPLETWSAFIRYSSSLTEEDMAKLAAKNPALKEAGNALNVLSKDSLARLEYDKRVANKYFYERSLIERYAEGEQKGKAEGEHQRSLEIARQMKSRGFPVTDIVEMTGLSAEEVEQL